jgi:hypothetical protein
MVRGICKQTSPAGNLFPEVGEAAIAVGRHAVEAIDRLLTGYSDRHPSDNGSAQNHMDTIDWIWGAA